MSLLLKAARGVWEFLVGDDWLTALGVVATLTMTALIAATGAAAWWVTPPAVIALLALSLRRATSMMRYPATLSATAATIGGRSSSLSTVPGPGD